MSSILDALKKVERESTPDQMPATPWPAPPPRNRQRNKWRWVPLGIVVGLGVLGVIAWQIQSLENNRPADSAAPAPPVNPPVGHVRPESGNQEISPSPADEATQDQAPAPPKADPVRQTAQSKPEVAFNAPPSMARAPAASLATRPGPAPAPEMAPPLQPPSTAVTKPPLQTTEAQSETKTERPSPPNRAATIRTKTSGRTETKPPEEEKNYRDDPRIELQALVWAPEADARFVIINNRLIKEGANVDDITVVQINPDDVVLAEGSDRWVQKFSIR